MNKHLLTIAILLISVTCGFSQFYTPQNMVWTFGATVGLNFNSGAPIPFSTSLNTYESNASVCNSAGNILFYTDGKKVYNRMGNLMPNGASIVSYGTISTTQGSIITPVVGDTNKYYIFSLQNYEDAADTLRARLSYSVVDMTLNGGLGDVIPATAGTFLYGPLTEGMVAITGNNNNIWLVSRRFDTTLFVVFNISLTGISPTPTLYAPGTQLACTQRSTLKASHDRRILAYTGFECMDKVTLFDFDAGTGAITNPQPIMTPGGTYNYGVEFSPDNSKLYVGASHGAVSSIKQYDISVPTAAAMLASEVTLTEATGFGALRLAPNGKIYFPNSTTNTMGCINAPNNSGTACGLVVNALTTPHAVKLGLPPIYVTTDTSFDWVPSTAVGKTYSGRGFSLFPNPATNILGIQMAEKITSVQMYHILGKELLPPVTLTGHTATVYISDLSKGIYVIRVNERFVQRFCKE